MGVIRPPDGPFTVVLFGEADVGKTSIITNFATGGAYRASALASKRVTIVSDMFVKTVIPETGNSVMLTLWDTAGAEKYHSFMPVYMRMLDAAVIVFSVDDPTSMRAIGKWQAEIAALAETCALWYVVANKMDLIVDGADAACVQTMQNGMQLAKICEIDGFMSTSAATGDGVEELFQRLAVDLRQSQRRLRQRIIDPDSPETGVRHLTDTFETHVELHRRLANERRKRDKSVNVVAVRDGSSSRGVAATTHASYLDAERQKRTNYADHDIIILGRDGTHEQQEVYQRYVTRCRQRAHVRNKGVWSFC